MMFRQVRGYGIIVDPDPPCGRATTHEFDLVLCGHCEAIVEIKPGLAVHRCTCCDRLICSSCVGKGCDPIEEKLRRAERRAEFLRRLDRE
jgi:hypothetical protein